MINLQNVSDMWYHKVEYILTEVNGLDINDTEDAKEKASIRSEKAEVSRKLLELADMLALMEAYVRNEYWYMKGRGVDVEIGVFDD